MSTETRYDERYAGQRVERIRTELRTAKMTDPKHLPKLRAKPELAVQRWVAEWAEILTTPELTRLRAATRSLRRGESLEPEIAAEVATLLDGIVLRVGRSTSDPKDRKRETDDFGEPIE